MTKKRPAAPHSSKVAESAAVVLKVCLSRRNFEKAATTRPTSVPSRCASHHMIVSFAMGKVRLLVRNEVDAVLGERGKEVQQSGTSDRGNWGWMVWSDNAAFGAIFSDNFGTYFDKQLCSSARFDALETPRR